MHFMNLGSKRLYHILFFLTSSTQLHLTVNHRYPHRTRANMFNISYLLTYLQASTHDSTREHSHAIPKNPSFRIVMLYLITTTALAIFHIYDYQELRRRDQKQQSRLAAPEDSMIDIIGNVLPDRGSPLLNEDDDFKLPPPAYEFHEGFLED